MWKSKKPVPNDEILTDKTLEKFEDQIKSGLFYCVLTKASFKDESLMDHDKCELSHIYGYNKVLETEIVLSKPFASKANIVSIDRNTISAYSERFCIDIDLDSERFEILSKILLNKRPDILVGVYLSLIHESDGIFLGNIKIRKFLYSAPEYYQNPRRKS